MFLIFYHSPSQILLSEGLEAKQWGGVSNICTLQCSGKKKNSIFPWKITFRDTWISHDHAVCTGLGTRLHTRLHSAHFCVLDRPPPQAPREGVYKEAIHGQYLFLTPNSAHSFRKNTQHLGKHRGLGIRRPVHALLQPQDSVFSSVKGRRIYRSMD